MSAVDRALSAKLGRRVAVSAAALAFLATDGLAGNIRVEGAREAFTILDMDGDRKVTFKEFAFRKQDAFSASDRNEDGYLGQDEVLLPTEQFAAADRDGDGHVQLLEFIDSRYGQFDIYDANSDGTVTLEEFTRNLVGD
jgi:Ca2+-binding EF-hand superfamily protein